MYNEIEGDLIKLGQAGAFDVIAHGCNCFCNMGAGLAPQMAKAFNADIFPMEADKYKGDIHKLGTIDYEYNHVGPLGGLDLAVVNCYSQFGYGKNHKEGTVAPLSYPALQLCFTKMNHIFKGRHIGLPQIGCHLAGGDWNIVKQMIQDTFTDCPVTVVIYKPTT